MSIASLLMQPSPNGRRVGIRIVTFEACSSFTHVTARRIAQPPTATLVTRHRPFRLPGRAACQLPDQSTILWVASSSTGDSRLQGHCQLRTCWREPSKIDALVYDDCISGTAANTVEISSRSSLLIRTLKGQRDLQQPGAVAGLTSDVIVIGV